MERKPTRLELAGNTWIQRNAKLGKGNNTFSWKFGSLRPNGERGWGEGEFYCASRAQQK